jgi:predicted ATPase
MLQQMWMKNFKSWVDTGTIRLAPLTGFFGANSSGKSSLLQMLLLLKQTAESPDRGLILRTNADKDGYVNLGTIPELIHNNQKTVEFGVNWTLPKPIDVPSMNGPNSGKQLTALTFDTQIVSDNGSNYVKQLGYADGEVSARMLRRDDATYDIAVTVGGKKPLKQRGRPYQDVSPPVKCYGFSEEALRYYQNAGFLNDFVLAFERQLQRIYYLGPLREYPQRIYSWAGERPNGVGLKGELAVAALLAAKDERVYSGRTTSRIRLEQCVADKLVAMGMATSFETKPLVKCGVQYELRLKRTDDSQEVVVTDMGFGVSQVLPVLVLCYYVPEGSTIILEQPEIHLHPSVQAALADVFIDVVANRNVQILVESHSEHFIRRLQRRMAEEMITPEDTRLYFCDYRSGQSTLDNLQLDSFGNIRNWPSEFFGDLTGDLITMAQTAAIRRIKNNGASNAASD